MNLGDDGDTTGAIYGQLAGAYYGINALPQEWIERLALRELIHEKATALVRVIDECDLLWSYRLQLAPVLQRPWLRKIRLESVRLVLGRPRLRRT